jgi:hypothetical protein
VLQRLERYELDVFAEEAETNEAERAGLDLSPSNPEEGESNRAAARAIVDPRPLISRVFSLKDAGKAVRHAQQPGVMKVLLRVS